MYLQLLKGPEMKPEIIVLLQVRRLMVLLLVTHVHNAFAVDSAPSGTTAWPEICRVMALYRNCSDVSFRIACQQDCSVGCIGAGATYVPSKGVCYGVVKDGRNIWSFAQESCKAYGGELALVKDQSDADVIQFLMDSAGITENDVLVGGLSIGRDNIWVNIDGTEIDNKFWASSKPQSSDISCLVSKRNQGYKLDADNCQQNFVFVCEASINIL